MSELDNILEKVANVSGFSPEDIKGRCRKHELVATRVLFCQLCEREGFKPEFYSEVINRDRTQAYHYRNFARSDYFINLKRKYEQRAKNNSN